MQIALVVCLGVLSISLHDAQVDGLRCRGSWYSSSTTRTTVKAEQQFEENIAEQDGTLRRSGSFGKLREVLRRSSEMLVKKIQGTMPPEPRNTNMKRAASLGYLNRNGDDNESFQGSVTSRTFRNSRPLSSSTVELYKSTDQ